MRLYRIVWDRDITRGYFSFSPSKTVEGRNWKLYKCEDEQWCKLPEHCHDAPSDDPGLRKFWNNAPYDEKHDYRCAFTSMQQMTKVFCSKKLRDYIGQYGGYLAVFEVPKQHVKISKQQCLYLESAMKKGSVTYHRLDKVKPFSISDILSVRKNKYPRGQNKLCVA